jgi:uncharacterized protein (DUF362 family)
MQKPVVSIVKGEDPEKMVKEALDLLGGVQALIKPKSTVVLKPNAGHPGSPETSINTNPDVVAAVINEIKKAGPKEIILAEAAAIGCDTMECFASSGILEAAEKAGIDKIIDIKSEKDLLNIPIRDARSDMKKIRLPRFLIEAEHIVNLPIFKTHCSMVFTCALKNMKGVVQDVVHYQMHQTNLAEAMMDLWSVIRPDLTIADMIRPAEGFGPHLTMPVDFGCVVAGKDPVAVDATACRMAGLSLDQVPYFEPARDRGIGNFDEKDIEIRGNTIKEVCQPMWLPYLEGFEKYPEYEINTENACSSCLSLVGLTMEKLKSLDEYDENKDAKIFIGRKKTIPDDIPPDQLILVGDCLKKYRKKGIFIEGCPPGEPIPHWMIADRRRTPGSGMEPSRERMAEEEKAFMIHMKKLKKQFDEKSKGVNDG